MIQNNHYVNDLADLTIHWNTQVKNSVTCTCNRCGKTDTYRVNELREDKIHICKNCKQGFDIGDVVHDFKIAGYFLTLDGLIGLNGTCLKHNGSMRVLATNLAKDDYKCTICERRELELKRLQKRQQAMSVTNKNVTEKMKVVPKIAKPQTIEKPKAIEKMKAVPKIEKPQTAAVSNRPVKTIGNTIIEEVPNTLEDKQKSKLARLEMARKMIDNSARYFKETTEEIVDDKRDIFNGVVFLFCDKTEYSKKDVYKLQINYDKTATIAVLQCLVCGTVFNVNYNIWKKREKHPNACACSNCHPKKNYKKEEVDRERKNLNNLSNNIDYYGMIKNNLMCIDHKYHFNEAKIPVINVKCVICKKESEIYLNSFLNNSPFCDNCINWKINTSCPKCHKQEVAITVKDLMIAEFKAESTKMNSSTHCKSCGEEVTYAALKREFTQLIREEIIKEIYKGYTPTELVTTKTGDEIFKFSDNYVGTNKERYYTCMCLKHNKMMVLTDKEMDTYDHRYCADTRMKGYKQHKIKPKASNINDNGLLTN